MLAQPLVRPVPSPGIRVTSAKVDKLTISFIQKQDIRNDQLSLSDDIVSEKWLNVFNLDNR